MDAVASNSQFRWGRFAAVAALGIVAGVLAVEVATPERFVREATAVAEVELRVDAEKPPTADQVRRRALSTANLSAVWRRLTGGSLGEIQTAETDEAAATLDRWRKQIVVEVRPGTSRSRARIRFLIDDTGRDSEAAILVEAIAAQYAGELAAEPWYILIDRLRSAEDRADAATDRLLNAVGQRPASVSHIAPEPVRHRFELDEPNAAADEEIFRLTRMRERLLETLTPAHPDVVALDARLEVLVVAMDQSPIRRMSGEVAREPTPLPAPNLHSPAMSNGSPTVAVAAAEVAEARAAVRARLDDLTTPGAVEAPVVTTFDGVHEIWELRNFWRLAVCLPALVLAWATARGDRNVATNTSSPISSLDRSVEVTAATTAEETPAAVRRKHSPPVKRPIERKLDTTLDSLEQVAEAVGAPVLAVVVRRREPRPTATA